MPKRKKEISRFAVAADAIGLTHLVIGTIIILLGEFTDLFTAFDYKHAGVRIVLEYLDAPIFYPLKPFLPLAQGDPIYYILTAFVVLTLGSIVYGLIAYFILKFVASLAGADTK